MKKILIIITCFILSCFHIATASENKSYTITDEIEIKYDELLKIDLNDDKQTDKWIYKKDDHIVLTITDVDYDQLPDIWLSYKENMVLVLEAYDTNSDGKADMFFELSEKEKVTKSFGDGLDKFKREESELFVPPTEQVVNEKDDFLIEDVDKNNLKKGNKNVFFIVLISFIILGVGFWKFFKK